MLDIRSYLAYNRYIGWEIKQRDLSQTIRCKHC